MVKCKICGEEVDESELTDGMCLNCASALLQPDDGIDILGIDGF